MAGQRLQATASGIAIAANTARTVVQLVAPTNQMVEVTRLLGGFYGISGTEPPIRLRVVRQTGAGTGRATLTPTKRANIGTETIQTTATSWQASATEPTNNDVVAVIPIHPQGNFVISLIDAEGNPYLMRGGERLGFEVLSGTTPSNVNMDLTIEFEE